LLSPAVAAAVLAVPAVLAAEPVAALAARIRVDPIKAAPEQQQAQRVSEDTAPTVMEATEAVRQRWEILRRAEGASRTVQAVTVISEEVREAQTAPTPLVVVAVLLGGIQIPPTTTSDGVLRPAALGRQ